MKKKLLKSSSSIKQQLESNPKKIDHIVYVFDQRNSFYPAHVPVKYGFQIRSLIENNHLPSWQFSQQDKNQIIYKSSFNQNSSEQHRWINSLLNTRQLKEQHKQLSSFVHQCNYPFTHLNTTASQKASPERLLLQKNCSDKLQIHQQQTKIKRNTRCTTFEEHLQRYYLSKWCLTTSRNFYD